MNTQSAQKDTNKPLRDVLIPSALSVSPRVFYTVENDYAQWRTVDPRRLWITSEGQEWLAWRKEGLTVEQVIERANASGLRYRRGAVELFFHLADAAFEFGWQEAIDEARVGLPTLTVISPSSVTRHGPSGNVQR